MLIFENYKNHTNMHAISHGLREVARLFFLTYIRPNKFSITAFMSMQNQHLTIT